MTQRPFSYDLSAAGQTLTLHGEVDEAASIELRDLLRAITADLVGELRINLTDVDFLPSVAIGVLAGARNAATTNDASVTFVAADGSISRRVLTICGIACDDD
jgi:anti-anti-sigma factor